MPPEIWQHRLNLAGPVLILPATEDVEDRADLPFVGTACAGAAARLVGVIGRDALVGAIQTELGSLGAQVVDKNTETALQAYDLMEAHAGSVTEGTEISASNYTPPDWVGMTVEDVDRAAPSIHAAATSVEVKTGLWRTLRPVIDYDRCNRCWWVCSTFCPDSAITVDHDGRPEIDYDHCKGCMICVAKCPPHAIEAIPEHRAHRPCGGGRSHDTHTPHRQRCRRLGRTSGQRGLRAGISHHAADRDYRNHRQTGSTAARCPAAW